MSETEIYHAHMEAERAEVTEPYFAARPSADCFAGRFAFSAGFERAYDLLWRRWRRDALRYQWLRDQGLKHIDFRKLTCDTSDIGMDHAIDVAIATGRPPPTAGEKP